MGATKRYRRRLAPWCALAALALPFGANAQDLRAGTEFQVNTFTADAQARPAVAADADPATSSWSGRATAGRVGLRRLRAALRSDRRSPGDRVHGSGPRLRQPAPRLGGGRGQRRLRRRLAGRPVRQRRLAVRRLRASILECRQPPGRRVPGQHLHHLDQQCDPSVASEANGDFVVVWQSNGQDGGRADHGVFARRFSSTGTPLATEFQVNTYTSERQAYAEWRMDNDGDFVVVWQSYYQDGTKPTASSAGASPARALRSPSSSRSTPTPTWPRSWRPPRWPPTATSSSPGRVTQRRTTR